jgi:hypothetical protein
LNYQELETKSLLTDGFEYRVQTTNTANLRWNVTRVILLQSSFQTGEKKDNSELFTDDDYDLLFQQVEPKVSYQLGTSFRATLSYTYAHKKNVESMEVTDTTGQHSISNKVQIEVRYSTPKAGSITAHISYEGIQFNADQNSPIAYDMLEGLHSGDNFVWGLAIQKNLSSSLQLTVSYDGRKSEGVNVVHTANVQMRALF